MNTEQLQHQLEIMLDTLDMNMPEGLLKHAGRSSSKTNRWAPYSYEFCLHFIGNMCVLATLHLVGLMDPAMLGRYEKIVGKFEICIPHLEKGGFQLPPQVSDSIAILRNGPS